MKTIIIGGVAGGASAAARLRRLDEEAEIILLERGKYISYANCGLPYFIGGEITDKKALTLQTPQSFNARFAVDVRIENEAVLIDAEKQVVTIHNLMDDTIYTESYDNLILSPGAEPVYPAFAKIEDDRIFTLRTIPDTFRIHDYIEAHSPKTAVIIGGGFIGLEMAENLTKAGLSVSLVEASDHILAPLDYDMAAHVHHYLREKGLSLYLKQSVKSLSSHLGNLTVHLSNDREIKTDLVLLAIGVRPDTQLAKTASLAMNERGAILVDEFMQTSSPHIYAVGDAVEVRNFVTQLPSYVPLAGPANKQGRIAADHIAGLTSKYSGTQGSSVLKLFDLTIATTGLNEKQAAESNLAFDKVCLYPFSHATYYPGASSLTMKVVFEKETGRILGAQTLGFEGAEKRIDVLATAIRAGMTAFDLTELELCYAPPFSSAKDPVNMAGFMIENILKGKVEQFHWNDADSVVHDENALLLDVRTEEEYQMGHIEGSLHIPLHLLRNRIEELDSSKTIYVHCQSGLRSYVACRILSQKGFRCFNLAGGYSFYDTVTSDLQY
ncbi:FAD-dependent oxidoreductase [Scatolibacter rhodanostii]|uniref:FAD-dependent oxidoreductase n=1 Tax=Scatolibacter rhodanostii TaxID=2014781 RepID=UPI000C080F2D|nr:FAD-dependent oxidoreductase [Scatolibacter rhodanostii]